MSACGTPGDRHDPDPYEQPANQPVPTQTAPSKPPPPSPAPLTPVFVKPRRVQHQGLTVGLYSYGDIAKQLRMPMGFAVLAGLTCSWQHRCNEDAQYHEGHTTFDCKVQLARLWCPPDSCSDGGLPHPSDEWAECNTAIVYRECEPLETPSKGPIDCPLLRKLDMKLDPKTWLITDKIPGPTE